MKTSDAIQQIIKTSQLKPLVVLVGAGVSTEMGLPIGRDIVEQISTGKYREQMRKASIAGQSDDFFFVLDRYRDVVTEFEGEEEFYKQLEAWMGYPNNRSPIAAISESYELLAHLLHHRVVSTIVSLNFDEFLDEAIRLEIHNNTMKKRDLALPIKSINEFEAFNAYVKNNGMNNFSGPIYMKPHGTISRRQSLRFSPSNVGKLEPIKVTALKSVFDNAVVLTLGWSARDIDVFQIMANVHSAYIVRQSSSPDEAKSTRCEIHYVTDEASTFLKKALDYRSMAIAPNSALPQQWLGPTRHYIRAAFFAPQSDSAFGAAGILKPMIPASNTNQLALEVMIHILKARGYVQSEVLADCPRIQCLAEASNEGVSLQVILAQLVRAKVIQSGSAENGEPVYTLHTKRSIESIAPDQLLESVVHEAALTWCDSLNIDESVARDRAVHYLVRLANTFDVDVKLSSTRFAMFRKFEVIERRRDLCDSTRNILRNAPTDSHLHVSAYTGEWLISYIDEIVRASFSKITLIVEDFSVYMERNSEFYARVAQYQVSKVVHAFREQNIDASFELLVTPRKVHNMTILTNTGEDEVFDGIYFRRELKTPAISPVRLSKPEQADESRILRLWNALLDQSSIIPETPTAFGLYSEKILNPQAARNIH